MAVVNPCAEDAGLDDVIPLTAVLATLVSLDAPGRDLAPADAVHAHRPQQYGGEEFACLLPGTNHAEALVIAHNIRSEVHALAIEHCRSAIASKVTVSLGVATARCIPGASSDLWIKAADQQLYIVKTTGRDNVAGLIFDTTTGEAADRLGPDFTPLDVHGHAASIALAAGRRDLLLPN